MLNRLVSVLVCCFILQGQTGRWLSTGMSQLLKQSFTDGGGFERLPPGEVTPYTVPFVPALVSALIVLPKELEQKEDRQ